MLSLLLLLLTEKLLLGILLKLQIRHGGADVRFEGLGFVAAAVDEVSTFVAEARGDG